MRLIDPDRPTGKYIVGGGYVASRWKALAEAAIAIARRNSDDWPALRLASEKMADWAVLGLDSETNPCRVLRQIVGAAQASRAWRREDMAYYADAVIDAVARNQADPEAGAA